MNKILKNDTVKVMAGRDKGKTGRVLTVYPKEKRALVEGVNYVKRHTRRTQQDPQGGIITKESPINISSLMVVCKACNSPTKIGISKLSDGTRTRFCRKCNEIFST